MRLAFDIGGTFTDVVAIASGRVLAAKVPSLLDKVGSDIARRAAGAWAGDVVAFVPATPLASTAVTVATTPPTGLLVTRGFRDDIELRTQKRPDIFDVRWVPTPPLVPRHLRVEVDERMLASGEVERPLDEEQARGAVRLLLQRGARAIAVCFINSYRNPAHEVAMARIVNEIAPDLPCCISSEVHAEIREYERSSTTVINASLIPVVRQYLNGLHAALGIREEQLLIMQSNGGVIPATTAAERPVDMIESGPAAGVLASARVARELSLDQVLSFDMGGTTAKACFIENGSPIEKPGGEIGGNSVTASQGGTAGGYAVRVPSLDITEVGAGGGSIAWIDMGGALRVGPQSAAADPGPACYGRGGTRPTVTDANLVLGYISPDAIADGSLKLDPEAAERAIHDVIAAPLGLSLADAAYGIVEVANAKMIRALRAVSTERGRDPRLCDIVAFGGAGPMHAARLADDLGTARVYVPVLAGVFSAVGLLLADYRRDYVDSVASPLLSLDMDRMLSSFSELETRALKGFALQGISESAVTVERWLDVGFGYQLSFLSLPLAASVHAIDAEAMTAAIASDFHAAHLREFGFMRDEPLNVVNIRVRATAQASTLSLADIAPAVATPAPGEATTRTAYFGPNEGFHDVPVVDQTAIRERAEGPLVVATADTTVVVPPGWAIDADVPTGTLILARAR
jgi:N-methylhydantoinase A